MPTVEEAKAALGRPEIAKLQQLGTGLEVETVLGNRVLIEVVNPETIATKAKRSGLYIPEDIDKANTPKASAGIVLQLGTGVTTEDAARIPPGTMVMFSKYAGNDFTLDEKEGYRILDTYEIMFTLRVKGAMIVPVAAEPTRLPAAETHHREPHGPNNDYRERELHQWEAEGGR